MKLHERIKGINVNRRVQVQKKGMKEENKFNGWALRYYKNRGHKEEKRTSKGHWRAVSVKRNHPSFAQRMIFLKLTGKNYFKEEVINYVNN